MNRKEARRTNVGDGRGERVGRGSSRKKRLGNLLCC